MKLILALFLCGVVYATALPTCSERELDKCQFSEDVTHDVETEAFLNEACRSVGCATRYKRRCGTTGLPPEVQAQLRLNERVYNTLCGKKNKAMRQKYLDNARCINRVTLEFSTSCPTPHELDEHDPNYCPIVEKYISCTKNLLSKECGSDAREVYEPFSYDLEFYGC